MRLVLILAILTLTACSRTGGGYPVESILRCNYPNEEPRIIASNNRGFSFEDGEIQWWEMTTTTTPIVRSSVKFVLSSVKYRI